MLWNKALTKYRRQHGDWEQLDSWLSNNSENICQRTQNVTVLPSCKVKHSVQHLTISLCFSILTCAYIVLVTPPTPPNICSTTMRVSCHIWLHVYTNTHTQLNNRLSKVKWFTAVACMWSPSPPSDPAIRVHWFAWLIVRAGKLMRTRQHTEGRQSNVLYSLGCLHWKHLNGSSVSLLLQLAITLQCSFECIWGIHGGQLLSRVIFIHRSLYLNAAHNAELWCTSIETCGWKFLPGGGLYTTSFSDV